MILRLTSNGDCKQTGLIRFNGLCRCSVPSNLAKKCVWGVSLFSASSTYFGVLWTD